MYGENRELNGDFGGLESTGKKRRVRKGTHSCWECRRRKIKCKFPNEETPICITCEKRGSKCTTQEFSAPPPPSTNRRLASRLGQLEEMMVKLVEQNRANPPISTPTSDYSSQGPRTASTASATSPAQFKHPEPPEGTQQYMSTHDPGEHDLLESTAARNAHALTSCAAECPNAPLAFPSGPVSMKYQKYLPLSKQLHSLLPPLEVRQILCSSPGARDIYITNVFNSDKAQLADSLDPPPSLLHIPSALSHPSLIAKRLMQYVLCIQQTPPGFDMTHVVALLGKPLGKIMSEWATAVSTHVTTNDDLISNQEGLEALILYAYYLSDLGHLRKSWMNTRRALNMCQMMGLPKTSSMLRSCDPNSDPSKQTSSYVHTVWFRVNCNDRFLSLMLGLPVGSRDDGFAEDDSKPAHSALEKFAQSGSRLMRRICERNELPSAEAYATTQKLDEENEEAAKHFAGLWNTSQFRKSLGVEDNIITRYGLEVRHHTLLLMIHLPYVLRAKDDKRYEYNRTTCVAASKSILIKFLDFRSNHLGLLSGRHIDYAALVAAMTLLLGYVGRNFNNPEHGEAIALVQQVKDRLNDMAALPGEDKLARESADILGGMLSFTGKCSEGKSGEVHLNVPFLGRVNIVRDVWGTESNSWDTGIRERTLPQAEGEPAAPVCTLMQSTAAPNLPETFFSIDTQNLAGDASNNSLGQSMMSGGDMATGLGGFDLCAGWPDLLAEPDDWALQGVDATYWNMVNQRYTFDPKG